MGTTEYNDLKLKTTATISSLTDKISKLTESNANLEKQVDESKITNQKCNDSVKKLKIEKEYNDCKDSIPLIQSVNHHSSISVNEIDNNKITIRNTKDRRCSTIIKSHACNNFKIKFNNCRYSTCNSFIGAATESTALNQKYSIGVRSISGLLYKNLPSGNIRSKNVGLSGFRQGDTITIKITSTDIQWYKNEQSNYTYQLQSSDQNIAPYYLYISNYYKSEVFEVERLC